MVSGIALLRKWWKTAAMQASSQVGDNPLFLADYLLRLLRVAVLLSLWRTILQGKGAVSGMSLESVLVYTLIAEAFHPQFEGRTRLEWALWDGSIATRLTRPFGIFAQFASETMGGWLFDFLFFSAPLIFGASLLGIHPFPATPAAGGWFVLSLVLAVSVGMAVEFVFVALLIALEYNVYALDRVRAGATALLSGAFLPLAFMPWGLERVFAWLPFAAMASAPLRIYTGTGDVLSLIGLQVGWAAVLWPLAFGLWRRFREKLVSYGG